MKKCIALALKQFKEADPWVFDYPVKSAIKRNPLGYLRMIYDDIKENPSDLRKKLRDAFWQIVLFEPWEEAAIKIYKWDDLAIK